MLAFQKLPNVITLVLLNINCGGVMDKAEKMLCLSSMGKTMKGAYRKAAAGHSAKKNSAGTTPSL